MPASLKQDDHEQRIDLGSKVEKKPKLNFYKAPKYLAKDWEKRFGKESVRQLTEAGKVNEALFRDEKDNLLLLNQKNNPNVPKILEHGDNFYRMEFIRGVDGTHLNELPLSKNTKLLITQQTLNAVNSVFKDGVVNMEYAPKNSIIIPNPQTGKPERVVLIDFGVSFKIDQDGKITVDMDLFSKSDLRMWPDSDGVGLFPPELKGKNGKFKIDAEKYLVWQLTHRVIVDLLKGERFTGGGVQEFVNKSVNENPDNRPSFREFIDFYNGLDIDQAKVDSIVSAEELKSYQQVMGTPTSEVAVSEKQIDQILAELGELKKTKKK